MKILFKSLITKSHPRTNFALSKHITHISIIMMALGLAHSASAMPLYRISDLGAIRGYSDDTGAQARPRIAINDEGQVALYSLSEGSAYPYIPHAFRIGPNQVLNTTTDDLGALGNNPFTSGINNAGQVVGTVLVTTKETVIRAFRTAPNKPINLETDDLGTLGIVDANTTADAINSSGQVAGSSWTKDYIHAWRNAFISYGSNLTQCV